MNIVINEKRLGWLGGGHVLRMEDDKMPKQVMYWQADHNVKRKPGSILYTPGLKSIGMSWADAE